MMVTCLRVCNHRLPNIFLHLATNYDQYPHQPIPPSVHLFAFTVISERQRCHFPAYTPLTRRLSGLIRAELAFFDEYATQHIFPQQERARAEGSSRPRGVGLELVERRLLSGERSGQDKFSSSRPDKTGWDNVDHAAMLLIEIREMNKHSVQGLFLSKRLIQARNASLHLGSHQIPRVQHCSFKKKSHQVHQSNR